MPETIQRGEGQAPIQVEKVDEPPEGGARVNKGGTKRAAATNVEKTNPATTGAIQVEKNKLQPEGHARDNTRGKRQAAINVEKVALQAEWHARDYTGV